MHSMQAFYSGDANFIARSFDPVTQTVQPANSTTALGSSANPAIQTVSFTATVGSPFGTPTGTVVFHDGVNQIGTGTLDNQGVATLGPTALSQGVHQISAIYQSDGNYVSSAAVPLWQVVNSGSQQTTTSLLSSSLNPVLFRRTLTLLTTVNSTSCAPTGTVTFLERGTALGQRGLDNNGQASLDYAKLTIGAHAITAVYEGDSNCGGSISSTLMQYRSPAPRTLPRP